MDIKNLKTFVRVAELKSFTKAAKSMNYVQSTVTMQIQQLEKELGYPLFDRIGKKISLTSLGNEFLIRAYEILHIVENVENLNRESDYIGGALRIGVTESLMFGVLMELLPKFKEKHKNVELSIKTGHTNLLIEELKQNELDIVYIAQSTNTDSELRCYYKRQENLVFLSGNKHIAAQQGKISLQELMKHDFLVTEREGICYGRLKALAAQYGATLIDPVEVDSVYVITELAKNGMGICFLPEYSVSKLLKSGSLKKLEVDIQPQIYFSQILMHKSRWISPYMASFIDMIKDARPEN